MFREVVQELIKIGEDKASCILRDPSQSPTGYWTRNKEGDLEWHETPPAPRAHKPATLESICRFALDALESQKNNPVIWYAEQGITLLVNDANRFDRLTCQFTEHAHLKTLRHLEKRPQYMQSEFIKLLRIDLAGTHSAYPDLLVGLRAVKLRQITQGAGDIQHSKQSISRSMEAELSGTKNIPENVNLYVQLLREFDCCACVNCAIEIDAVQERFYLIPLPGEIDTAMNAVLKRVEEEIHSRIMDSAKKLRVPVYRGVP